MTETEQRLVDGFRWLSNVHHENFCQPRRDGGGDRVTLADCTSAACRYAREVLAWVGIAHQ